MNDIQSYELSEKQILLFNAPRKYLHSVMPQLIARMAIKGNLFIIDAGNAFRPYSIAREIRRFTENVNISLENIKLSRVFTCYQVLTRLETLHNPKMPVLVLDLLDMFYDEHTSSKERERLLFRSLDYLKRTSLQVPVAISCAQSKNENYADWIANIRQYADEIVYLEQAPAPENYRLF
ncbi:MAG: hypothetical protein JEZ00_00195 [Anaerolineaceae bacterium]|nr:hypothetical protein [Anaerolineaceae bacterium]